MACLQAIIWTNAGLMIRLLGTNLSEILIEKNSHIFIHENAFESVVCEMSAIVSWPQWMHLFKIDFVSVVGKSWQC